MPAFSGQSVSLIVEPITDAAHGRYVTWARRIYLQLAAQLEHVRVDRASDDCGRVTPHRLHQLQPGANLATVLQELEEQVVFLGAERDFAARLAHAARDGVDFDVAEAQHLRRICSSRSRCACT